jgi:hypothetical protein
MAYDSFPGLFVVIVESSAKCASELLKSTILVLSVKELVTG